MDDYALLADEERRQRDDARTVTPDDVYAGMAADEVASRDNALKASLRQAVPVSPDTAAKSRALSNATGVPVEVVDRNTEIVSAQARVQELQKLAQQSPVLARQLADPEFAKLSHDDAENLSLFERTFKTYLGASVKSGLESLVGTGIKLVDALNPFTLSEADAAVLFKDKPAELAEFMRDHPSVILTRFTRAMQQASEATMQGINPEAKVAYGDLKYATLDPSKAAYLSPIKVVGDAIQSLPTTLALAVSVYLTKGTAARVEAQALEAGMTPELARKAAVHAAAETMAKLGAGTEGAAGFAQQSMQTREQADRIKDEVLQGSPEYQRLIAQGYTPEAARVVLSSIAAETAGAAGGAADAVVNYFGGGFLGKIITEGGALLKRAAKGFATEGLTEAAQGGLEQLGQNKAVQAFLDPNQELLDGVAEQIAQGFVVGGVMGGAFGAVAGRKRQVEQAAGNAAALQRLFELAAADKLRERSPADFARFVQGVADESGTPAVFIDAATFAQAVQEKGLDLAATMPETAAQLAEAIATKGDVRIPLGELTAALPGTGLENTLMQHMRTSIDGPTLAETQDKQFAEQTQAEVAKVLAENDFTSAHKESAAVVENELLTQLTAANRFTKDVNSAYAKLMASFYAVQAARLGITPEEMYVKYPLRIQAERAVKGASMDQVSATALIDQAIEIAGEARFQTLGERALLEARAQAAQTNAPFGEAERATVIESLAQRIVAAKEAGSSIFEQPAYHGSPHDFEKFSTEKIGTGEGAAAYGWGLYFAENPGIAAGYHERLAGNPQMLELKLGSMRLSQRNGFDYSRRASENNVENVRASLAEDLILNEMDMRGSGDVQAFVLKELDARIKDYYNPEHDQEMIEAAKQLRDELAIKGAVSATWEKAPGGVYQVEIPDEAVTKMLDWDKPLKDQPEAVKELVRGILKTYGYLYEKDNGPRVLLSAWKAWVNEHGRMAGGDSGEMIYQMLAHKAREELTAKLRHQLNTITATYGGDYAGVKDKFNADDAASAKAIIDQMNSMHVLEQKEASLLLLTKGVPGIRYLDAASRDKGRGTRNLVVFDENIVKLTHKDGKPLTAKERKDYFQEQQPPNPAGWQTADTHDPSSPDPLKPNVGSRGLYNVDTRTISLLKNADLSTFLHESGHFYLEVMADIASQPNAPAEIVADMNKLLAWFGVNDLGTWQSMSLAEKRPHHEKLARGFEAYLFEGKAPSQELAGLFARFRAWMLNVYRQLAALNVELSDEVRGVFNRMLATLDEIVAAEAARGYAPLFKSAAEMGATPEEWRAYQEQGLDATQEAIAQLEARGLRDMKWLTNAKGRVLRKLQKAAAGKRKAVEAEVTAEVRAQPVYAAIRFLAHGELPAVHRSNAERKLLESIAGLKAKLSIPDLKALYGDGPAAPWRYLNAGKFGTVAAEDGVNPEMVAELFGFTSGDELVRKILAAEPEATVIEGMTDQRMLERYGDLSSPEAIEQAANEAIHNEARAKFMATELRALAKATGQKNILAKAAKEFAATIIGRKRLREISPAKYAAAEARAGRAAERAKSLVEKATEKRNQIVNHYATRAAYDAIDEIQKGIAYLRRVGDSKTVDPEYREQINALLERFDLRKTPADEAARRASLLQWVEEQRERGFEPVIDAELLNEAKRMPYQEMPLEEFRGLVDAVKNIEHLGRLKHRLLTLADQREFAAVVGEAADAIEANAKKTIPTKLERNTWLDKMKSGVAEFFAMHRKFGLMIREMDGHADNGVLWNLLVKPMNDAGNTEAVTREKATIELEKLLKTVGGKLRGDKVFIPEIKASLSREGRIMVALNTGNAGNLQRLMDGDGWTLAQVQAITNTLTKVEMDFVQSVWDFVGTFRDQIGEQQRRLTGVAPEWVEPTPVQTIHGEYRGGYIPAKYDTTRSTRSLSDEAAAGVMDEWRAARGAAKTRNSFTKDRANKVVDRPLRKDFGVITQHITEVTHRLAWQDYLIDAQRLLRAAPIDKAIREHYGPEVLRALRDTIKDVAAGEVAAQNAFESGVNYLRTGATIAGLGWRITTSLLQPFGLTQSMVRIGPMYVGRGIVEWLGDAAKMENTAKRIFEKSDFMRLRAKTMQREISEIRNTVSGRISAIEASYFYLIQKMQLVADIPTWLGQYHKAVEHGADEKGAVAQADQAVLDAQGGGQIKDLAAIQRGGPLLKLFTNFYSFFNTTYNMTGEAVGRTKFRDPLSVGRLAVDLLLLYSVPAAMGTLLKAALHSGDDGADDEKKLLRQLIADQLTYLFGTMVGLREIAGGIQTALGLPGDYQGPASVRLFAELAKLGKQAGQGEVDEALLKAAANVGGILFHLPSGQTSATIDGIVTMANGKTENPGALLVGSNKK